MQLSVWKPEPMEATGIYSKKTVIYDQVSLGKYAESIGIYYESMEYTWI